MPPVPEMVTATRPAYCRAAVTPYACVRGRVSCSSSVGRGVEVNVDVGEWDAVAVEVEVGVTVGVWVLVPVDVVVPVGVVVRVGKGENSKR